LRIKVPALVFFCIAFVGAAFILVPLLATVWIGFISGVPGAGQHTPANYEQVLADPFGYQVLFNTVRFAFFSAALAMLIAAPLAWAVARTDLPFRNTISILLGMVLVIPGFFQAMGWALLLSPNIGILNRYLVLALDLAEPPFNIYSLTGMTFAQGLSLVPPAFFILIPVFLGMDGSFEEAAYLSGAGKFKTFVRINLPLAAPAVIAAAIYVFILGFALFDVAAILGFPNRIFVFSTMLYFYVHGQAGSLPEYGLASAYGSIIMILSLLMAWYYSSLLRKGRKYATITGKGRRTKIISLSKWRPLAVVLVCAYFFLALFLPLIVLAYYSLLPFFLLPSWNALSMFTLSNYINVFRVHGIQGLVNTGVLISIVPLVVVLVSLPISWTVVRTRLRMRFALDNIAFLPLAVPRVVLSISLLYLALVSRNYIPIYGTIFLIAVAHVISFMSFATRTLNGALLQIHTDLEDAGRLSGASLVRVIRKITVPLLRPALLSSWFWVMLLSFREVTMAIMLSSADSMVLPAQIWIIWNRALPHQAAAAAILFATLALVLMLAMRRMVQRLSAPGGF
jgi:iron(III) transport system permease protein